MPKQINNILLLLFFLIVLNGCQTNKVKFNHISTFRISDSLLAEYKNKITDEKIKERFKYPIIIVDCEDYKYKIEKLFSYKLPKINFDSNYLYLTLRKLRSIEYNTNTYNKGSGFYLAQISYTDIFQDSMYIYIADPIWVK